MEIKHTDHSFLMVMYSGFKSSEMPFVGLYLIYFLSAISLGAFFDCTVKSFFLIVLCKPVGQFVKTAASKKKKKKFRH